MDIFRRFLQDESGAVIVEYGMISLSLTFISMAFAKEVGHQVDMMFHKIRFNLERL